MDINIDGAVDGIQCSIFLNNEYFLPIIFTTSYADSTTIIEASDTNIFGYLIKPFTPNNLEVTLKITFKRAKNLISSKEKKENHSGFPNHLWDHCYSNLTTTGLVIPLQYADDMLASSLRALKLVCEHTCKHIPTITGGWGVFDSVVSLTPRKLMLEPSH